MNVSLLGSRDAELLSGLRQRQFRASPVALEALETTYPAGSKGPDAFVVDVRELARLPREIGLLRRQFPGTGLVIVARTLESSDLLEAMRMGVNEWVAAPLKLEELAAAIQRVARPSVSTHVGRSLAVLGAKGGIGTTTVAVNLATTLHRVGKASTLFIDMHLAYGDAAVFLGVEPRFSVVDALENMHRMDESFFKGLVTPTNAGIDLLGSGIGAGPGQIDVARVRTLIEFASMTYRYVVLDCPRNDTTMLEAIDAASQIVVVANQELTTLRSASRIVNGLRQRCGPERVRLAISRFDPQSEIGRSDVERVLGGPVKYMFPSDYRTSVAAITRGEPLIMQNHSQLASSLDEFARDLGGLPAKQKDATKSGLFGRLGGRR